MRGYVKISLTNNFNRLVTEQGKKCDTVPVLNLVFYRILTRATIMVILTAKNNELLKE